MEGSDPIVEAVAAALGPRLLSVQIDRGETWLVVERDAIREALRTLREGEGGFVHLSSVWGVDYLDMGLEPRFAVVYHVYSPTAARRIGLKVPVEESDPVVPSVVEEWPTANWHEREVFDLFGIRFEGHPNLTRILTPDDWVGHPLRKDFPLGEEEVQFSHNIASVGKPGDGQLPDTGRG